MAGIGNNLYPPIVPTYMNAFVRTTPCKVYFSLSNYNDPEDIKNVQVIVSNQNSNLSALDPYTYPADIMITSLRTEEEESGIIKYYVEIRPGDLKDGIFDVGQYYKVQLRFTGIEAADLPDEKKIAGWLTDNQAYFSEWSTVCLIKGIEKPLIYLKGFENDASNTVFTSEVVDIVGEMYYEENSELEDEYLKSYVIDIYKENTDVLVYTSGICYTNEFYPNEINHTLKINLDNATYYDLEFTFTTHNEYTGSYLFTFSIMSSGADNLNATITATPDEDNGRMIIKLISSTAGVFLGNVCIRRASSEDNFVTWEDFRIEVITEDKQLDFTWYDYTVKSGVYYNYCAQKIDAKGHRGPIITIRYPVMLNLDDMFLTREDFQLRIRYDPQISSFKRTLSESKTETIGSQYPYIRRNGAVEYRQFPISGLITEFCDSDRIFSSYEELYGDMDYEYKTYNEDEQIVEYKDFFFERYFRDKVMDFLYGNNVKLFRGTPEGNILVRLMDISFTPNQVLGRMLYSFSATAYEVDECTIDNYDKYGIITIGEYSNYIEYDFKSIGQLNDTYEANQELCDVIQDIYATTAVEGYFNELVKLDWVRIEFQSEPYLIVCGSDGSLRPATADDEIDVNVVLGYIIYINGEPILVSSRGYYELLDEDTSVTSIYVPVDTTLIIDFEACIKEEEDVGRVASRMYWYIKPGQIWGTFDVDDNIAKVLYSKYYLDYEAYYRKLASIDRISIETRPHAVVFVKDSFDDDYYRHEIGNTGMLDFYDDEAIIMQFYFAGMQLYPMTDMDRLEPRDWEFYETGDMYTDFSDIAEPQKNHVYIVNTEGYLLQAIDYENDTVIVDEDQTVFPNSDEEYSLLLKQLMTDFDNRYIYYDNAWYPITQDNIVLCPVEGLVDYIFEEVIGVY